MNKRMQNPKFSIIVPVYNAESTICRCVESILAQTYYNFELLLVNDGSTDATPSIIDSYSYQDSRIHAIHKLNGGVSSARNMGLNRAKGEYIVFVDSDDIITPPHLSDYETNNADIIIGGLTIIEREKTSSQILTNKVTILSKDKIPSFIDKFSTTSVLRGPVAKAFKRQIIENNNIRFDEQLSWGEDFLFVMEYISKCNDLETLPVCRYVYYADTINPGKYKFKLNQLKNYVIKTERILNELNCKKYINTNRLWAYQTHLGFLGTLEREDKFKSYFKFITTGIMFYLPRDTIYGRIRYLIEYTRVSLFG